jgi:hypothetical protein
VVIIGGDFNMFVELKRAAALGAKYGLRAIPMYTDATVETPAIDESGMEGAVGIVVTLAAVIIALYITAIVVGSMSKTTTGLALPAAWNTTITALDTNATSSFSLAGILPIAIIGVGILVIIISAFAMR